MAGTEISNRYCDDICAVCETADDLKCCDGYCLRSFHADCVEIGDGRPPEDKNEYWACFDCTHGVHRCYICKEYGHDKQKSMVSCSKVCGHRFHKKCILKTLLSTTESPATPVDQEEIFAKYVCPQHRCKVCNVEEDIENGMQLLKCFRCTIAYCRKCLPAAILELSTTKFICARHAVETSTVGGIPSGMYKRLRPIRLEYRCRQPSKFFKWKGKKALLLNVGGYKVASTTPSALSSVPPDRQKSSSAGEAIIAAGTSAVTNKSQSSPQNTKKTIDWGKVNTNTDIVFDPVDVAPKPDSSSEDKSSTTRVSSAQFASVDEERFRREQAMKRRKIMSDFKKQQEEEKAAAAQRAATVALNLQRYQEMVDPTRRNPREMILIQNKMLQKLDRWIEQKKAMIQQKTKYLKSFGTD